MRFFSPLVLAVAATLCSSLSLADSRVIYRCEVNGTPVFSDRPCAPSAALVELDSSEMNTYAAPPIQKPQAPSSSRKAAKRASEPSADIQKRKEACAKLAQGLKTVRSKMRAGYKASEGERLKEQQKRLSSQLRAAQCR